MIYMMFFTKKGERMPQLTFHNLCERNGYNAPDVQKAAEAAGWTYSRCLMPLQDHINLAFPGEM